MIIATKPIKRSRELSPLSRDHHESLLFVWKIKQGLKYGINTDTIAAYCNWFLQNHLKTHFKIEENQLSKILPMDHPMMIKMFDDHRAIENKILQLQEYPSTYGLERLAQVVGYHVRFEEREMFNYIEEIASPEQLKELELSHITEKPSVQWKFQFWLRSAND